MVAEFPPAIAFMLSEFPGNKLGLQDVRKRLSDASFVRDFFDQCCAGIETFKYADRLEGRVDKFDVYAGHSLNPLLLSLAHKVRSLSEVRWVSIGNQESTIINPLHRLY